MFNFKKIITLLIVFSFLIPFFKIDLTSQELEREKEEKKIPWLKFALKGLTNRVPEGIKTGEWKILGTITLPLLKITDSIEEGYKLKGTILTSAGAGFSICKIKEKIGDDGKTYQYRAFSFSPFIILLTGDYGTKDAQLDISWAATIGLFNETIILGVGYDFGRIHGRNSRWFLLWGLGLSLPARTEAK